MNRFNPLLTGAALAAFEPQTLSRSDIRELEERSLTELEAHVVPRQATYQEEIEGRIRAEADPNRVMGDELVCLRSILKHPETIERRCERLGWDRDRERRARTGLFRKGLIRVGGVMGNKRKLYVPTVKGLEWAREQGEEVASYKSGARHEAVLREVKRGMESCINGITFHDKGYASALDGIQADTVARIPVKERQGKAAEATEAGDEGRAGEEEETGDAGEKWETEKIVAIQICDGNGAVYEAEQLCRLCNLRAVDLVLSVSVTRATREKLEQAVTKRTGTAWPAKLVLEEVERCLKARYDWNWIQQRAG